VAFANKWYGEHRSIPTTAYQGIASRNLCRNVAKVRNLHRLRRLRKAPRRALPLANARRLEHLWGTSRPTGSAGLLLDPLIAYQLPLEIHHRGDDFCPMVPSWCHTFPSAIPVEPGRMISDADRQRPLHPRDLPTGTARALCENTPEPCRKPGVRVEVSRQTVNPASL